MVLPTCPMAEFALPRHSAVMERLRRRIELCRRHHSTCEARYEAVSPERLELERQHTFALHQRCIQAKAKRAGKHRQPSAAAPAPAPAAPAPAPRLDAADGPEHGRPVAVSREVTCRSGPFFPKTLPATPIWPRGNLSVRPNLGPGSGETNLAGSWLSGCHLREVALWHYFGTLQEARAGEAGGERSLQGFSSRLVPKC
jgi:hypothetical protein